MEDNKSTKSEAYIRFQLEVMKKEIQDFQEEVIQLEEKKQRWTELQKQLKKEQTGQLKVLWRQAKEQERFLEQEEVVSKEQVELAQELNLETGRSQEAELAGLHSKLRSLEEQVLVLLAERHIWLEYKNVESQKHQRQIQLLEAELAHMRTRFQEEADYIKRSLEETLNEIHKKTDEENNKKKHLAAETAIKQLDETSRWEINENERLKKELAMYKREVSLTKAAVQVLEGDNLELINQLFEHTMSRNLFLAAQACGLEPCDLTAQEKVTDGEFLGCPATGMEASGTVGRLRSLERDEPNSSCSSAAQRPIDALPQDLNVLLFARQTHLQDEPVHLGPLEKMLLTVVGHAAPLHPPPSEDQPPSPV